MYPQVARLPEHIEFALNCMVFNLRNTSKAIVCGMGTCNIAGLVVSDYLDAMKSTPLPIAKGIDLPKWVDKDTTVIVVSYSGDTVETLHLYRAAVRAGAQVVCITSGGELEELCVKDENVMLSIPGGALSLHAEKKLEVNDTDSSDEAGCSISSTQYRRTDSTPRGHSD